MTVTATVQPYLFFDGKCEEALEFYKKTLDAKVGMMMRAGESPEGKPQDVPADKIMHAGFTIGNTSSWRPTATRKVSRSSMAFVYRSVPKTKPK